MQLYLDLKTLATRTSILLQLEDAIGESGWSEVVDAAAGAGVPMYHHHGIVEVRQTIDTLKAPETVKEHMHSVYEILAQAEAKVHGCTVDETHFHEVGEGQALYNTLIICIAFDKLKPETVTATPVQTGTGTIECAHGLMDIPAPATKAILDTGIPTCEEKLEGERCTPTSAAIIKHFVNEYRDF